MDYKKGINKFLPDFFIPKIKPRIIQCIKREDGEDILVTGINIKPIDFNNRDDLDKYLQGIKEVLTEEVNGIYIEGQEGFNRDILKYIEDSVNVKVFYGEDTKIKYLPTVMKKACSILKENLQEKEVLILDDNINRIKETIKEISGYVGYITVVGLDEDEQNDLYDYILEETGISIFYPFDIGKIAENYSIIINFMTNIEDLLRKFKRQSFIFDFSQGKYESLKNRPPLIQDFFFNFSPIKGENYNIINAKISSSLFAALSLTQYKEDVLLYAEGKGYSIRNYIDNYIKFKGRF
ncbi:MAG: hypothetical protein GX300_03160 [Tissierellia bacterium]|nr:hypothetical protein [Tissierellia bacterium]